MVQHQQDVNVSGPVPLQGLLPEVGSWQPSSKPSWHNRRSKLRETKTVFRPFPLFLVLQCSATSAVNSREKAGACETLAYSEQQGNNIVQGLFHTPPCATHNKFTSCNQWPSTSYNQQWSTSNSPQLSTP